MAIYNEILVGRVNRSLQKAFAIKGDAPTRQLGSELTPSVNLFWGVEQRYLESWERFGVIVTQPAVAAQTADIRLRNPVGSNVVAVIESIEVSNLGAAAATIFGYNGAVVADLATGVSNPNGRLDARGRPTATLLASRTSNGAFPGGAWGAIVLLPNTTWQFVLTDDQELTLLPGDCVQISMQTVNQSVQVGARWRERFLEDSERT